MSVFATIKNFFKVSNIILPQEGPIVVPVELDFSGESQIDIDGLLLLWSGKISFIQGVYIDNLDNPEPVSLTNSITRQRITAPANSQGYYDIFCPNPLQLVAETVVAADLKIKMHFYNVPIQSQIWPNGSGANSANPTYTARNVALDGTSQTVNGPISKLVIQNPTGNGTVKVNLAGGDALATGIELAAGGSLVLDSGIENNFTVSGTNGQTLIIYGG
jgi:hypothetical protein